MNHNNKSKPLKQYLDKNLDQIEARLSKKHQQRLNEITQKSLQLGSQRRLFSFHSIIKPLPVLILTSILMSSILINTLFEYQKTQEKPENIPDNRLVATQIPTWVKDTQVPLELLENMDFYVWLSQHDHTAKYQDQSLLATARTDQFRSRQ
jgi:hypothetical protein